MWIWMALGNVDAHNGALSALLLRICHITKQKTSKKAIKSVSKKSQDRDAGKGLGWSLEM